MSSDFEGSVKDFAMVVPVPVVLQRDEIRTVDASLFKMLDDYSAPRLSEYYDDNPCQPKIVEETYKSAEYMAEPRMEKTIDMADGNYQLPNSTGADRK